MPSRPGNDGGIIAPADHGATPLERRAWCDGLVESIEHGFAGQRRRRRAAFGQPPGFRDRLAE